MDIKERFYANLEMIREEIEKGNPNIVRLERSRRAAQKALKHVNKKNYQAASNAVEGTPLAKNLRSYLDKADNHWTKMNIANNKAGKPSTPEDRYYALRDKAAYHQDQAEHHHGKAVEYLRSWSSMNEEAEHIHEGIEKGNPNIVRLNASRAAAKRALPRLRKNDYEGAHAAVKGTALEKPLKSYLDRAQTHWTKMNVLNNEAGKTSTSSDKYDKLRSRANDHKDRAESHHGKAVEYLRSWSSMNEEAEQLDELKRKTLADYIIKAHKDTNKQTVTLDNPRVPEKYAKVAQRKFRNRNRGIERAARKLSK